MYTFKPNTILILVDTCIPLLFGLLTTSLQFSSLPSCWFGSWKQTLDINQKLCLRIANKILRRSLFSPIPDIYKPKYLTTNYQLATIYLWSTSLNATFTNICTEWNGHSRVMKAMFTFHCTVWKHSLKLWYKLLKTTNINMVVGTLVTIHSFK